MKTNIGHLEAGAGTAGLIKLVLVLLHREAPPNLHLKKLNQHINVEGFPLVFPHERTALGKWTGGSGRIVAGLSSFGFGGTNAHVVVEEAEVVEKDGLTQVGAVSQRPEAIYNRQSFPWAVPSEKASDEVLFEVAWEEVASVAGSKAKAVLVLGATGASLKQLIEKAAVLSSLTLVEHGACEGLEAVESSQENVRLYRADLTSPAHLAALIALETWSTVVSLPSEEDTMIKRSLALVKGALSPSEGKARPSSLWFVSAGALPVDKDSMSSEASARQSWVSGFVKTLGIEHVELGVRHVDVGGGDDGVVDGVCRLLDGSMSLPEKEAEVAVRGSRLYVPRLVGSKASISAPGSMGVVPAATYVITGGLGALGLVFAERLIEEGAENVVLLSRSGASGAAAEAAVEKLRGSKARVEVLKCDV